MGTSCYRLAAALAALWAVSAWSEVRVGQNVVVRADEQVAEDLYVVANTVRVDGTIDGDLVTAAGTVEVSGQITGDVLAAAGTTRVTGPVAGSLRVLTGELNVSSAVGEDVAGVMGRLIAQPTATLGRDVLASTGELRLAGPVAGDVKASAGEVELSSSIAGAVDLTATTVTLNDGAHLGALTYRSEKEASIAPGALVGSVTRSEPPVRGPTVFGFFFGWARAFIAFTALGLLLALISPRFAQTVPEVLTRTPWKALGIGALVLLAAPFVALGLFLVGLAIGGWWLGFIAGAAVLTALALSFPAVGYRLGQLLLVKMSSSQAKRWAALMLGLAVVTLALRVPLVGALVALGVVLFGLGSMLLAGLELRRGGPLVS